MRVRAASRTATSTGTPTALGRRKGAGIAESGRVATEDVVRIAKLEARALAAVVTRFVDEEGVDEAALKRLRRVILDLEAAGTTLASPRTSTRMDSDSVALLRSRVNAAMEVA